MPEIVRKNRIAFFLNDREVRAEVFPDDTALEMLRLRFGLTGTKEGCNEGDCGACTVAIGESRNGKVEYRAFTSCLVPAARLQGKHVITIEGLGTPENLHPIQRAILDHHATQCGFCTPGVVMSLFCLFAKNPSPAKGQISEALEGNLCRCTGYLSIMEAGHSLAEKFRLDPGDIKGRILPGYCGDIARKMEHFNQPTELIGVPKPFEKKCLAYHLPDTLDEYFDVIEQINGNSEYRIISGGTDVMVDANIKDAVPGNLIDITHIKELRFIREEAGRIVIGANVTMTEILDDRIIQAKLPLLCSALLQMASLQIRNAATLAGNLATASPIGDAATALLALNAVAILKTRSRERRVPLEDFFKGYRQTALDPHELIKAVEIPIISGFWDFQKSAKRNGVDISSVSSAMTAQTNNRKVTEIRIAIGGVAPTPVLAKGTMEFLQGKSMDTELIEKAARIASSEVTPISDVRGSKEYRNALVRNHVAKHLYKLL